MKNKQNNLITLLDIINYITMLFHHQIISYEKNNC